MLNISLESCDVNALSEVAHALEEMLATLVPLFLDNNNASVEVLETKISESVRCLSRPLLEIGVCQQASEEVSDPVACPECGQSCRPWTKRERNITTVCGVIRDKGDRTSPLPL